MAESVPQQQPQPEQKQQSHPLQSAWSFWYDDHKKSNDYQSYQQGLQQLSKFDTLEDFWHSFSYIAQPDALPLPRECSLYLSRNNEVPAWETYPQGGCWLLRVHKNNKIINRLWEELVFACIAELFELPDVVCVAVSTRLREDVLSIWNIDNSNPNIRFIIGEKLRALLNLDESTSVEYKTFRSSIKDKSSFKNARGYGYVQPPPPQQQPSQHSRNNHNNTNNNHGGNNKQNANHQHSKSNQQPSQPKRDNNNNNKPANNPLNDSKGPVEFSLPTVFVDDSKDTKA